MQSFVPDMKSSQTNLRHPGTDMVSHDQVTLARLGKKQVLKVSPSTNLYITFSQNRLTKKQRNFGFLSMISFSCTVLVTWEGILV